MCTDWPGFCWQVSSERERSSLMTKLLRRRSRRRRLASRGVDSQERCVSIRCCVASARSRRGSERPPQSETRLRSGNRVLIAEFREFREGLFDCGSSRSSRVVGLPLPTGARLPRLLRQLVAATSQHTHTHTQRFVSIGFDSMGSEAKSLLSVANLTRPEAEAAADSGSAQSSRVLSLPIL